MRTDPVEVETLAGTLRPTDGDTIAATRPGIVTAIVQEEAVLTEGDAVYAVDGTMVPLMFAPPTSIATCHSVTRP